MKFCGKMAGKIAVLVFLIFMLAGCNKAVSDVHVHTYSENLSYDSTGHWYAATCEHSTEKKEFAEHVTSGPATETQAEVCTVCGYEINPVVVIPKAAFSISDEHVLKMEIPDEVLSEYKKEGAQLSVVLNINMEKTYIDNVVRKTILLSEFREKEEIDFSEILSWYDLYFALHENKYFVEIILCDSDGKQVKKLATHEKSSDGLDFTGLPKITLENNEIKISKFSEERLAKLKERGAIGVIHVLSMSKEDPAFKENTEPFGNWDKVWLFDKYFDMDHIPESFKLADIINYTDWRDRLNSNGDIFVDMRIRNKMEWDEDTVVYYWSGAQKLEWEHWETEIDNILPFREVNDDYVGMKLKINEKFIPETASILIIRINDKQVYRVDKNTAKVHETEWLFPYVNAVAKGEAPYVVNFIYYDENWKTLQNYTRCIYLKKQGLGNIEIISEPEVTISDAGKLKYTTLPELKIGNTVVKGDVIPEDGVFKSVIYKNGEWYHSATWGNGYAWDRVSDNLSNEWDIAKTLFVASKKTNEEELSLDLIYLWKDESGYEYQYPIFDKGKYNFKIDWAAYEEANNNEQTGGSTDTYPDGGNGANSGNETPAEKGITVSLKGANVAAYGVTPTTVPVENKDGSCTYETNGQYLGGGMYFYVNADKSEVDLNGKVIKVEAELEKTAWSLPSEPNFCLNVSDKEAPDFWGDFKTLQYFDSANNEVTITKAVDSETKITCIGIKLNTYGLDATENDKVKVTIKSIKIVDAE